MKKQVNQEILSSFDTIVLHNLFLVYFIAQIYMYVSEDFMNDFAVSICMMTIYIGRVSCVRKDYLR